jgi:hypothetical protein
MNTIFFEKLKAVASISLRFRKNVNAKAMDDFRVLTEMYRSLSDEDKSTLNTKFYDYRKNIFSFSSFAAEMAMNTKSSDWILAGLIAHMISGVGEDYRMNIMFLHLLNHAAAKLQISIVQLFNSVSELADTNTFVIMKNAIRDNQPLDYIAHNSVEEVCVDGLLQFKHLK